MHTITVLAQPLRPDVAHVDGGAVLIAVGAALMSRFGGANVCAVMGPYAACVIAVCPVLAKLQVLWRGLVLDDGDPALAGQLGSSWRILSAAFGACRGLHDEDDTAAA